MTSHPRSIEEQITKRPRTLGESNAKRPDENLLLEDLRRATKVVAATVHDLLSA